MPSVAGYLTLTRRGPATDTAATSARAIGTRLFCFWSLRPLDVRHRVSVERRRPGRVGCAGLVPGPVGRVECCSNFVHPLVRLRPRFPFNDSFSGALLRSAVVLRGHKLGVCQRHRDVGLSRRYHRVPVTPPAPRARLASLWWRRPGHGQKVPAVAGERYHNPGGPRYGTHGTSATRAGQGD